MSMDCLATEKRFSARFSIRSMTLDDMNLAIAWATYEGWNPGLCDAIPFRAADPEGFLMGVLDDEPVAAISAVRYGSRFGFMGFYMVKPAYRGQGYGMAMWKAAISRLQGRVIGLDGVVAQQANYQRSGFELAHHNMRFEGVVVHEQSTATNDEVTVVHLTEIESSDIFAYDRQCFPESRCEFLRKWITQPGTIALGAMKQQQLVGYGVARPCQVGWKIGPLFADSLEVAEKIHAALKLCMPEGAPYFLDISDSNPDALALVEQQGLHKVFDTARMYLGPAPEIDHRRIFGITSFELG